MNAPQKKELHLDSRLLRQLEALSLIARRRYSGETRAERRSKKTGAGILFAEHKSYVPGDDFRSLDWNAFERTRKLLVRTFEQEEDIGIHILIDASASMQFGEPFKFEYGKKIASALGYIGLARLDRVSFYAFTENVQSQLRQIRGKNHTLKMLSFLDALEPQGKTYFYQSMKDFVVTQNRPGIAIVISDFYDSQGVNQGLNILRYNRFEPHIIHIIDKNEEQLDLQGDLRLIDIETKATLDVSITPQLLHTYVSELETHQSKIREYCQQKQVPYHLVDIRTPLEDIILRVLQRGGLLG